MKKLILILFMSCVPLTSSYAWWDGYGGYHCTYLDPLTSFFDSIFGPPCVVPTVVVQTPPIVVEKPVPVPVAVPQPYPVLTPVLQPYPVPVYPYY